MCVFAGARAHVRRRTFTESARNDGAADHLTDMLERTGLRMDRRVLWKTIDVAGIKKGRALRIANEELKKGPPHVCALVNPAFTTRTSLRSSEVRGHDCVALPLTELRRLTTRLAFDAFSTSERQGEHQCRRDECEAR